MPTQPFHRSRVRIAIGFLLGFAIAGSGNARSGPRSTDVTTGDRLTLALADDGSVRTLSLDSKDVPLLPPGGFVRQDMSRQAVPQDIPVQGRSYAGVPLKGGTIETQAGGVALHRVESAAAGVSFEARYTPHEGYVEIQTRLRNLSPNDRALMLYFRLPFDAAG